MEIPNPYRNEETADIAVQQSASIKLSKNSRGYNWEIRILEINVEKLEKINNEMLKRFGPS